MKKGDVKVHNPPNIGWLQYRLNSQEMDYVWRCIDNKKERYNKQLAGIIDSSYRLHDTGDWFYRTVVTPLLDMYAEEFHNIGTRILYHTQSHPYHMNTWWVNYQRENEFNPLHNHSGVYSFVIWMKIPVDCREQNKIRISRQANSHNKISVFEFSYQDILGTPSQFQYNLIPEDEGTMVLFPAALYHQVYPFYNCDKERISVSGNIYINTAKHA